MEEGSRFPRHNVFNTFGLLRCRNRASVVLAQKPELALERPMAGAWSERKAERACREIACLLVISAKCATECRRDHRPRIVLVEFTRESLVQGTQFVLVCHQVCPSETQLST